MAVLEQQAPKTKAYNIPQMCWCSWVLWLFFGVFFPITSAEATEDESSLPKAHVQFFGDVFIDHKFLGQAALAPTNPLGISDDLQSLLRSSFYNIANFEGVVTSNRMKFGDKTFHLRMPTNVPSHLARLRIDAASIGNNHSMDFGLFGLFETMARLNRAGIATFGAGLNSSHAFQPLLAHLPGQSLCVFSFAKTYPASTWATTHFAGVANPSPAYISRLIQKCTQDGFATIVVFHWGRELEKTPQTYQRDLAHSCIDAGAMAVIGHHPHVLQDIEVYDGAPIFYSVGNFLFSSAPVHSVQEGVSVRLILNQQGPSFDIVPLQVNNRLINFQTRLLQESEPTSLDQILQTHGDHCKKRQAPKSWTCRFSK